MGDAVVHFELNGPDLEAASRFYADLLGWRVDQVPGGYGFVDTQGGAGINGGIGEIQDASPFVTFYVEVPDLQATLDRAASLGARVVTPVTEVPGVVTFAQFADPAGNLVGVVAAGDEEGPGVSAGDGRPVDWFEVLGPEPHALWAFYGDLFGWSVEDVSGEGYVYGMVDTGTGRGIDGGIGGSPGGEARVTVYARVDDIVASLKRAESLGGRTLMPPFRVRPHTTIALLADPQGRTFGLWSTS